MTLLHLRGLRDFKYLGDCTDEVPTPKGAFLTIGVYLLKGLRVNL